MREKDQTTVEEYDCEHEATIERLQELITRKSTIKNMNSSL